MYAFYREASDVLDGNYNCTYDAPMDISGYDLLTGPKLPPSVHWVGCTSDKLLCSSQGVGPERSPWHDLLGRYSYTDIQ
ncbi:hypothetical protein A0H81_01400 [Grifola frondosa]|uniref:Uncharacterized protein n=1 Tax=Grifola frondosa TaxID=5627 RepID=A0A1C7MS47_GRIFR|nr:hypothetical protein A0H81_01400 [Grifola frondosa]